MASSGSSGAGTTATDVWVVLVCGLPGSGKSSLRSKLVNQGWEYVCQDELQTRRACEKAFLKALKSKRSCVVDRCNVTSSDRRLWLQSACNAVEKGLVKNVRLHFEAVWMSTPPSVCKQRAAERENHDTLSPEDASAVIDEFCKGLCPPARTGQEPYECVQFVATAADECVVLQRYANPFAICAGVCVAGGADILVPIDVAESGEDTDCLDSDSPAEVFVIRHGERADKVRGDDGGWPDDPPLTRQGQKMAKSAGTALRSIAQKPWAAVYSSPFFRCLQTANEIAAELGLPVIVEPGLSELCNDRIFRTAPQLRPVRASMARALTRATCDTSMEPVQARLPPWPERGSDANGRVRHVARTLIARHPGQAVCLVCHSHSAVEITRALAESGGGSVPSQAAYCALSHIAPSGLLLRCLDQGFLHCLPESVRLAEPVELSGENDDADYVSAGRWKDTWCWKPMTFDPLDDLFNKDLESVLEAHPSFQALFARGSAADRASWFAGWNCPDDDFRKKVQRAYTSGIFK